MHRDKIVIIREMLKIKKLNEYHRVNSNMTDKSRKNREARNI